MVWQVLVTIVALWLLWKSLSLGLRLLGWVLIAIGALNAGNAPELAGTVLTIALGLASLFAGHAVFYLRHGYWKPRLLENLTQRRRSAVDRPRDGRQAPLQPAHRHFRAPRPSRHHPGG